LKRGELGKKQFLILWNRPDIPGQDKDSHDSASDDDKWGIRRWVPGACAETQTHSDTRRGSSNPGTPSSRWGTAGSGPRRAPPGSARTPADNCSKRYQGEHLQTFFDSVLAARLVALPIISFCRVCPHGGAVDDANEFVRLLLFESSVDTSVADARR
jgi:hypothetical protein